MRLRLGILGGGYGASVHLPAALKSPNVEILGIATSGRRAPSDGLVSGVRHFDGWERLIDERSLDAVIVALPPLLHKAAVVRALGQGLHVLCEKPFGTGVDDALAMVSAASEQRQILAVNYQFRYEPGIIELRRRLEQGEIGTLRRVDIKWVTGGRADAGRPWGAVHDRDAGGGVVRNLFSHSLDYALWLTGKYPSNVIARGDIYIAERFDDNGCRRPVSAEDSVDCWIEMEGSVVVSARVTNCQHSEGHHEIVLSGEHGTLGFSTVSPFDVSSQVVRGPAGEWQGPAENRWNDSRLTAVVAIQRDFFAACRGETGGAFASGMDALKVQQLTDAIYRSLHKRSFVSLGPNEPIIAPKS